MMNIAIVGDFGTGKTTFAKHFFLDRSKKPKLIYCTMNEDFNNYGNVYTSFVDIVRDGVDRTDLISIIDEAETAIPHNRPDFTNEKKLHTYRLGRWLVDTRKKNHLKIFAFHSLDEIPLWFFIYLHRLIRFNTKDFVQYQMQRLKSFPNITNSLYYKPQLKQYEFGKTFKDCFDEITIR